MSLKEGEFIKQCMRAHESLRPILSSLLSELREAMSRRLPESGTIDNPINMPIYRIENGAVAVLLSTHELSLPYDPDALFDALLSLSDKLGLEEDEEFDLPDDELLLFVRGENYGFHVKVGERLRINLVVIYLSY
ncbi:MAG: hypothetical protein QXK42_02745 [Candidatus Korarchaeum sp.]